MQGPLGSGLGLVMLSCPYTLNTQEVVLQTFTGKVRGHQSKGITIHTQHSSRPPAHLPLPNCQVLTCFAPGGGIVVILEKS